ncbi:hypothetical protein ABIC83_002784 [Roseateles asaccharophilus]|uniref:hypothetical protein n=1 Tax=Roseateles asaccharophilus TaxID=582607 RepID=UPI00383769B5
MQAILELTKNWGLLEWALLLLSGPLTTMALKSYFSRTTVMDRRDNIQAAGLTLIDALRWIALIVVVVFILALAVSLGTSSNH